MVTMVALLSHLNYPQGTWSLVLPSLVWSGAVAVVDALVGVFVISSWCRNHLNPWPKDGFFVCTRMAFRFDVCVQSPSLCPANPDVGIVPSANTIGP